MASSRMEPSDSNDSKRICLAWEQGSGHGHLIRHKPYLNRLGAEHQVSATLLSDIARSDISAEMHGFEQVLRLPAKATATPEIKCPSSYADVLVNCGLARRKELSEAVEAWCRFFDQYQPGLMIVDCAPVASVAAIAAGVPTIWVGSGYECPPDVKRLPRFEVPWPISEKDSESRVLDVVNRVIRRHGADELPSLSKLVYRNGDPLLLTAAELDPYHEHRTDAAYTPITPVPDAEQAVWPEGQGPRLLFYCSQASLAEAVLSVLSSLGWPTLAAGAIPDNLKNAAGPNVRITDKLIDMRAAIAESSCVVSNGSHGVSLEACLAGVPVVALPDLLERYLISQRLQATGRGVIASPYDPSGIVNSVRWAVEQAERPPPLQRLGSNLELAAHAAQTIARRMQSRPNA